MHHRVFSLTENQERIGISGLEDTQLPPSFLSLRPTLALDVILYPAPNRMPSSRTLIDRCARIFHIVQDRIVVC